MKLQRFHGCMTSNFNGLNRFRNGENMRPLWAQRQQIGFNVLREWTAFNIPLIGYCPPTDDLYDAIPDYFGGAGEYGHYIELTAFTGPYPWFSNEYEFLRHDERLRRKLDGLTNLFDYEAVNEGDNLPNLGVPLDKLQEPAFLCSHGSAVQDAPPMLPVWKVAGHRPGGNEWWRKVGHNAMADVADVYNIPAGCNETIRMPDNDSNPIHAYDAAASATLLCAWSCFHSPRGKNATLWQQDRELLCAQAWADGAHSVPLEFQAGEYYRRDDPNYLRVYGRRLPDGRTYEVPVRF